MKVLGVIPARFDSTRFPGKPLAMIHGQSMIQRVFHQATAAKLVTKVVVATDDHRIYEHVLGWGGSVVMTGRHPTGTDRMGEVMKEMPGYDVYINIQGDEPYIHPDQVDLVAASFIDAPDVQISTLAMPYPAEQLENPNLVKVVRDRNGFALYFSRYRIPFIRDAHTFESWNRVHPFLKHIGIYGFRSSILDEVILLPQSSLELAESLEQLRWLENGYRIHVGITTHESPSVDTPEDLERILRQFAQD